MTLNTAELHAWLTAKNAAYRAQNIPHKRRPFDALREFSKEFRCTVSLGDHIANAVLAWFKQNSPPGAHNMGSVFAGVLLYDSAFWAVSVPYMFGAPSITPFDSLESMPESLKDSLKKQSSGGVALRSSLGALHGLRLWSG